MVSDILFGLFFIFNLEYFWVIFVDFSRFGKLVLFVWKGFFGILDGEGLRFLFSVFIFGFYLVRRVEMSYLYRRIVRRRILYVLGFFYINII